ncbi:MAG: sensor histidine kinase [Actinomycetota bacterium]|nr:sensor histidine kinase [Actinomycetota bacterium]
MRTEAAAGHRGYFHETAFYGSDEEFLAIVVPFLQGGLAAGEPTVVALGERNTELVRSAMAATPHLSFLHGQYVRPASVIKSFHKVLAGHVAHGAQQIRIVGEVPHPGVGMPWEWWARYEAAVNHAFNGFPLWGLCPYDTRITSDRVLDDVARTHPYLATTDGRHVVNDRYIDPAVFLSQPRSRTDPLETSLPLIDLVDPTPATARRAVLDAGRATHLAAADIDDLVYAVSEVVTNALCHGRPPVRFRLWSSVDRIVATVTDQGDGPSDPFAGLVPAAEASAGGLGLWITHQICSDATLGRSGEGFTIRLIAGVPSPAA